MIDFVARKKPTPAAQPEASDSAVTDVLFRADNSRLIKAIDAWAKANRRSRNMAMILLFEKALAADGFWPPSR